MPRFFKDNSNNANRALQIWQVLISNATNRQTLTYGILAKLMGYAGAGVLADPLGHIMYYCQQEGLPPLTVIVVNQETGLPGEGLIGAELNADREKVFSYDWFSVVPPTPEELRQAFKAKGKNS